MEQEDLGVALPPAYATALRLRSAGGTNAEIARCLDIDEDAIPALLRLADAKVAERLARDTTPLPVEHPAGGEATQT